MRLARPSMQGLISDSTEAAYPGLRSAAHACSARTGAATGRDGWAMRTQARASRAGKPCSRMRYVDSSSPSSHAPVPRAARGRPARRGLG